MHPNASGRAWKAVRTTRAAKRKAPLAYRVFLTLLAIFAGVVGLVALSMYLTVATSVESAVLGNVTRDMALAARDFETWLSGKIGTLETLRHAVLRFRDQPRLILDLLKASTEADLDIAWIYFGSDYDRHAEASLDFASRAEGWVERGGAFYVDGSLWTPDQSYHWIERPWYRQSASYPDPVISPPYIDEATGDTVVSISLACKDAEGRLFGVLAADVRLSRLTTVVSMRRFTPNSRTYLVDEAGIFVTKDERPEERPLIDQSGAFAQGSPLEGMGPELNSVERNSGLLLKRGLYYASSRVPRTSWLILSLGPVSDVASPVFNFYRDLALISVLAMVAAAAVAGLTSRALAKPVRILKDGALALAKGDYGYRVRIDSDDEFGELAAFFNHVADSLKADLDRMESQRAQIEEYSQTLEKTVRERTRELAEANSMLRMRNDQMEEEVQMAAAVQRKIVPRQEELPRAPGLSFGARYHAMDNVGGDLYDVVELGGGRYAFTIGDVSGHGIPAALIAAMAKASFRAHAVLGEDPSEILARVNSELCELIGEETYYVSAFLATLDANDGTLSYANAGHPPALLRRTGGQVEELDVSEGQLLGISEDFPRASGCVRLSPGDRLVLYTDGIVEARSASGEFYESPRLSGFVSERGGGSVSELAGAIIDDVNAFCGGARQGDDRAILAIGLDAYRDKTAAVAAATEEASAALEDLRRRKPDDPRVMNALAAVRLKLGDVAGAERLLRAAVKQCPDNAEYAANLAAVMANKET